MKVEPHEGIHEHKIYGRDDDDAILHYCAQTRRKCMITFEVLLAILEFDQGARHFQDNFSYIFNVRFSTGRW